MSLPPIDSYSPISKSMHPTRGLWIDGLIPFYSESPFFLQSLSVIDVLLLLTFV